MSLSRAGLFIASTLLVLGAGCNAWSTGPESITFQGPNADPAEWETTTPAAAGMDARQLDDLWARLDANPQHGLHSLLIVRHGKLVGERYWGGFHSGMGHDLRSATKSITSLLAGIAIEQGALGLSDRVLSRLATRYPTVNNPDPRKTEITVEHLLQMSSGMACDDNWAGSPGNEIHMYPTPDWTRFYLDLPMLSVPGRSPFYCTAGVVTLGSVIAEATGRSIPDFSREALFAPLGITHFRWAMFDDGRQTDAGGHINLRPRDMAKLGQLVLQRGQWKDRQVVPTSWIDRSTAEHVLLPHGQPYGYLWWLRTAQHGGRRVRYVNAQGNGGQMIIVVPELELVVVSTAGNYDSPNTLSPLRILETQILPAVESSAGR